MPSRPDSQPPPGVTPGAPSREERIVKSLGWIFVAAFLGGPVVVLLMVGPHAPPGCSWVRRWAWPPSFRSGTSASRPASAAPLSGQGSGSACTADIRLPICQMNATAPNAGRDTPWKSCADRGPGPTQSTNPKDSILSKHEQAKVASVLLLTNHTYIPFLSGPVVCR